MRRGHSGCWKLNAWAYRRAHLALGAALGALAALAGAASAGPPASPVPVPAQWRTYDLLIDLQQLPKSYPCMDLWYKFRDVLLLVGARQYMLIEPQRCQVKGGAPERSPSVHLKFQLPFQLSREQARYADTSSVEKLVRLAPGQPASLQDADCALVQQLRDELFAALPLHVTASEFHCGTPRASFAVALDAAVAVQHPGPVAEAGAAVPTARR